MKQVTLLIFLLIAVPLMGQTSQQVDSLLALAEIRMQAKAYQSALEFVEQARTTDQHNAAVYLTKGRVEALMGNYEKALEDLDKVSSIDPGNLQVIQRKAEVLYLKGEGREAQKLLDEAVKKHPERGEFYYYRGLLGNQRERYSRAIRDFEEALSYESEVDLYKIHLNKGVAHYQLKELDQALSEHDKAMELNKNDASAYHSRGMVYYELGEYQHAIADFSTALQFYSQNPETLFNLGMAYFRSGQPEDACVYFHRSCRLGNENACKMIVMECGQHQRR